MKLPVLLTFCMLLTACSPTYDWRETRGEEGRFAVMLPAKPAVHTRAVDLGALKTQMTMTAAQVEGTVFAVGVITLPDAAQGPAALAAMKKALVANIAGAVASEKPVTAGKLAGFELDVRGTRRLHGKAVATRMVARLYASQTHVYQVMALGDALTAEMLETFFTSFKPV